MAKLTIQPEGKILDISPAISLLNTLLREGVTISHDCGGRARCGTCRVKIIEGDGLRRPAQAEIERLGQDALDAGYRLACQTYTFKDLIIEIAPVKH